MLRKIAGPDAIDCGTASDQASWEGMQRCGSRAVASKAAFYCRIHLNFEPSRISYLGVAMHSTIVAAYAGTREGAIYIVNVDRHGVAVPVLIATRDASSTATPRRMITGMMPPRPVDATPLQTGKSAYSGLLIYEAVININGDVDDVRTLKALPSGLDVDGEGLVRATRFEPARLFGIPLAVIYNVSVAVDNGVLTIQTPEVRFPR